MAFKYAERVKETTTNKPASSATAFNLGGAKTGFQSCVAGIGSGNSSVFCAQKVDANGNPSGAWQTFVGTVTDAATDTLSQDRLIASSTGSFIDWSATGENSSPDVFCVHPASLGVSGFGPVNFVSTNQFYSPITAGDAYAACNISAGQFVVSPFFIPRPLIVDQMRAQVTTAQASANARLGIYKQIGAASAAMTRVLDTGEIDCSTTGVKTVTSLSTFLEPGIYWVGLHQENSSVSYMGLATNNTGALALAVMGHNSSSAFSDVSGETGLNTDLGGYIALPSSVTFTGTKFTNSPVVQMKFSEP